MHGLAGLTRWDPSLLPQVLDMLRVLSRSGTPAMRARGRILLKRMETGKELPVIKVTRGGRCVESCGRFAERPVRKHAAGAKTAEGAKTRQALCYG